MKDRYVKPSNCCTLFAKGEDARTMLLTQVFARRSGRDCRNPVAMEGDLHSPPCVLDTGNPCRYDGCVNSIERFASPIRSQQNGAMKIEK